MNWQLSHRFDKHALPIADSHYSRQKPGTPQFVPPGRCIVLLTRDETALWVTSWPFAEYVKHAWAGAWVNSFFCNRGATLSSALILEAIAATQTLFDVPPLGMVTFVDPAKVKERPFGTKSQRLRNMGHCYRKAGFRTAICPNHMIKVPDCKACNGRTKGDLIALQLLPGDMPEPQVPYSAQMSLTELVA